MIVCTSREEGEREISSVLSATCTSSEEGKHEISSVLQHALLVKKANMKSLWYCNMLSLVYFHCNRVSSAL